MDAVTDAANQAAEARRKYVEAWNSTMISIWEERIYKFGVIDTGSLYHSLTALKIQYNDGMAFDVSISEEFNEYGLWQEFGTGAETPIGNPGDIGRDKKRVAKKWMSPKYYASSMNLRDFFVDSLGTEFVGMFMAAFDKDYLRKNSNYYKKKGLA